MSEFWERMDGESPEAYEAFGLYRGLGITRSIRSVGQRLGNSRALIERRSRKWLWVARTQAFDAEEQRERSLRMRERRIKASDFHFSAGAGGEIPEPG